MASLVDISCAQTVLLPDASGNDAVVKVKLFDATEPVAPARLIWPTDHPVIQTAHAAPSPSADVSAYFIPDAQVSGPGASPRRDGAYLYAADVLPGYLREFVMGDIDAKAWAPPGVSKAVNVEAAFALIHYNMIYGHWLLEMFPKLFVIRDLLDAGVNAPIVLPDHVPGFILDFIRLVVPEADLLRYSPSTEHVAAETLICPGMFNVDYHFNPALNGKLDRLAAHCAQVAPPARRWEWPWRRAGLRGPQAPRRIFVSRSDLPPSYRLLINQASIEAIAVQHGLTVVRPENLSIREQIALFSQAELVVGEFGSGMHNTMFSPAGCKVLCLNWISEVQSRIANLRRHEIGYVLPDDGQPRTFRFQDSVDRYTIDPTQFSARLAELVG